MTDDNDMALAALLKAAADVDASLSTEPAPKVLRHTAQAPI